MSWTISVSSKTPEEIERALDDAFIANYPDSAPGVHEQFTRARMLVPGLVAVLDGQYPRDRYAASLSGHSMQSDDDPAGSHVSIRVSSS